jgi:hypothetical protein
VFRPRKEETNMLVDMWVSTLADYHVGQMYSSCDGIVALWRSELASDGQSRMAPKVCYSRWDRSPTAQNCDVQFVPNRRLLVED